MSETPLQTNLSRLLKEQDRSARSLALRAGLGPSFVKNILHGNAKNPAYHNLLLIAGELGVSVGELTGVSDTEPPPPTSKPRETVEDQTELSLLNFWRMLDESEQGYLLNIIRRSALGR